MVSLFELMVVCFAGICIGVVFGKMAASAVQAKKYAELNAENDRRWEQAVSERKEILEAINRPPVIPRTVVCDCGQCEPMKPLPEIQNLRI